MIPALATHVARPRADTQKIAVINGNPEILEMLEQMLEAGQYELAFIDSTEHAYSDVKRLRPNLVILCVRIENLDGFHLLSMLKLDEETRDIPVLTYTTEFEGQDVDDDLPDSSDNDPFAARPPLRMN